MDKNATKEVWNVCERFESKPYDEYRLGEYSLNKNFAQFELNFYYIIF